ncbi:MAG: c-type cytochrome [Lewinellaceae bacterium]|nr:c-type cytochrome [Lewinellaceae bacterium]
MKKIMLLLPLLLALAAFKPAERPVAGPDIPADIQALLDKHGCAACHAMNRKLVGPAWPDIAAKKYSTKRIAQLVAKPEPSNWPGYVPMAAQKVPKADMNKIADWLTKLK